MKQQTESKDSFELPALDLSEAQFPSFQELQDVLSAEEFKGLFY